MRLEDLKEQYPKVPEDIRVMVEDTVKQQLKKGAGKTEKRGKKRGVSLIRIIAAALIAVMALGATGFASVKLYQWHIEKSGDYGIRAGITIDSKKIPEEIPVLSIKPGYLPEGMLAAQDGSFSYYYAKTPDEGGLSISTVAMDADFSPERLPVSDKYVRSSEILDIGGKEAIFIKTQTDEDGKLHMDKMYIAYPEYWQILEIYIGQDVTKAQAVKVAENLEIRDTGKKKPLLRVWTWSKALASRNGRYEKIKTTASEKEMKNIHKIGERFTVPTIASAAEGEDLPVNSIQAKVTGVRITEDAGLLNSKLMSKKLKAALDEDGRLRNNQIDYIKSGNGTESLDQTVGKEKVRQKLVYVTVEFTNTGKEDLKNVLYMGNFEGIVKTQTGYAIYDRAVWKGADGADRIITSSLGMFGEMDYYDSHGGSRNNNYIKSLNAGESVTVHMGKIINADELDKMYLSFDTAGGAQEFTKSRLEMGYVDIRQ
ncbi:DUF4367 domain-containing protein [bacterium 210820-DFI.6.37]|nr:DUF4367 domain-containing protein [bacterium 210820-DFI.6.37]